MVEVRSFWANLGWSKSREVKVMDDGRAYFEIAEQGHCSTCQRRINDISYAVDSNKVDVRYAYLLDRYPADAKTLWVGIVIPKEAEDSHIRKLFRENLNLPM
jgi:hypothetical protein